MVRVMVLVMLATALGGADKESELPFALVDQRDVAALRDLLLQHPELVNARNALGASLLHHAVRQDEIEILELLLELTADVNALDANGWSALNYAVFKKNKAAVALLREHAASLSVHDAAGLGEERILRDLVRADPQRLQLRLGGWFPIHWATHTRQATAVRQLIELGADVNARAPDGITAAHLAAKAGDTDILKILATSGADINGGDDVGQTPLHFAAARSKEMVQFLLKLGADPNATASGETPLDCAIRWSKEDVVDVLLGENLPQTSIDAALFTAAMYGRAFFVPKLVKAGAHPDAAALRAAAKDNHIEAVEAILRYPVNIDGKDGNGLSALHYAARDGHSTIVQHLLVSGANPDLEDSDGRTPLALAQQSEQFEVVKLLQSWQENKNSGNRR